MKTGNILDSAIKHYIAIDGIGQLSSRLMLDAASQTMYGGGGSGTFSVCGGGEDNAGHGSWSNDAEHGCGGADPLLTHAPRNNGSGSSGSTDDGASASPAVPCSHDDGRPSLAHTMPMTNVSAGIPILKIQNLW